MKRSLAAGIISVFAFTSAPALAAPEEQKDPQTLASEGMQSLLKAMELMLLAIPQYEAPFVNENGDIIIRRKNPSAKPEAPSESVPNKKGKAI